MKNNVITALKLFNTLILPITRYGSEVWSPNYIKNLDDRNLLDICEKLPLGKIQTKFCRYILGVTRNLPILQLGQSWVYIHCLLTHSAKYWLHLCNTGIDSIAKKAHIDSCSINKFQTWATLIRKLWIHFSLPEIWNNHGTLYRHKTIHLLKTNILANRR